MVKFYSERSEEDKKGRLIDLPFFTLTHLSCDGTIPHMKKISALIIAFCFFTNAIGFTLAPPLISGNLGGETYHQKFLALAKNRLTADLLTIDEIWNIDNATDIETIKKAYANCTNFDFSKPKKYASEDTIYNPAEITAYYNMLERVAPQGKTGHVFVIPFSVVKEGTANENYRFVFSTMRNNEGDFPVAYCTEDEYKEIKYSIIAHDTVPYRTNANQQTLNASAHKYIQNEMTIDPFINGNERDYAMGRTVKKEKNPYWQAIEDDIAGFIKEDMALRIQRDGAVTSVKTDKARKSYEHMEKIKQAYELLDFWADVNEKLQDRNFWQKECENYEEQGGRYKGPYRDVLSSLPGLYSLVSNRFGEGFGNRLDKDVMYRILKNEEQFKNLQPIIYFYILPEEIQKWLQLKYRELSGRSENTMFDKEDTISERLIEYVAECLKKAVKSDIFMIEKRFHVSPSTKEITHVRRGIKQETSGTWAGEYFLNAFFQMQGSGRPTNFLPEQFALFLFNEAMHIKNESVKHDSIKNIDDIGKVTEHMPLDQYERIVKKDWKEFVPKPWEPLNNGKNVGKSASMVSLFKRINRFIKSESGSVLLISGIRGIGKSNITEMIIETMKLDRTMIAKLKCSELAGLSGDSLNERVLGKDGLLFPIIQKQGLLIIDELPDAERSQPLQGILTSILDDSREITFLDGTTLKLGKTKIVCLANRSIDNLREDLINRLNEKIELPNLYERGDDIICMAEFFNYEASAKEGITWAPLDTVIVKLIKEWVSTAKEKVQARDLKSFIVQLVKARAELLDEIKETGHVPSRDKNDYEEKVLEIFSEDFITLSDLFYGKVDPLFREKAWPRYTRTDWRDKYVPGALVEPYFKEFAPRNAKDELVRPYMGEKDEQPGMKMPEEESTIVQKMDRIMETMPLEFDYAGMNIKGVTKELTQISDTIDFSRMNEKSALIFSEKAAFDKGLAPFLAKIADSGMKVSVVAQKPWQKKVIENSNRRQPDEKKHIVILDFAEEAFSKIEATNFYYFKINGDPDAFLNGLYSIDITNKVELIVKALAEACHIQNINVIREMQDLRSAFSESP